MNNKKTNIYPVLILLIVLMSGACERVVDLNLRDDVGKLVIEANITNKNEAQVIYLTQNVSFSQPNEYPPVSGAEVSVRSNNGKSYLFKESRPGVYTSDSFAGIAGEIYYLTVISDGKTYQASPQMPGFIPIDSVLAQKKEISDDENERRIAIKFKDPINIQNQYRFLLHVNDTLIKQVYTTSDRLTDGREVTYYFQINDDDIKVKVGDSVRVEMQCVDLPIYTYWFTLESSEGSGGPGGGVTPSNPPTNIMPTVLGYFSAHTTETQNIEVQ